MASPEHNLQNEIRNALAGELPLFRAQVGTGWTGNKVDRIAEPGTIRVNRGDVVIRDARPFSTGLPAGFSDTFGVLPVTVTADMVGQVIGQAVFGEVKAAGGRLSGPQTAFLQAMKHNGARVGVWRSIADALATVKAAATRKLL